MKRAKKSIFSFGGSSRRKNAHITPRQTDRNINKEYLNINAEEDKDFQLKYYGKIIDDKKDTLSDENHNNEEVISNTENSIEILEDSPVVNEENQDYTDSKITKNSKDNHTKEDLSKNKGKFAILKNKYALIFTISLIAIILSSILVFCISGLFNGFSLFGDSGIIGEDYITPVDTVTGKVNVLVLGVDKEGLRTDTIIVASFDTDDNTVKMLSIPRDTRMYVGSRYQKINAAHAITQKGKIKGPQGTIEAVTRLTGIPINHYIEFSFSAFKETIDALDGVYYNVPQNMNYEDPVQDLYIHLTKGYQLLDGDKAEQLVRFRQYPEGDIKRVRVQQDFIKTLAQQKLNAGIITKLPDLYKTLSDNVKTSLTFSDVTKYGPLLLNIDTATIQMFELPGEYSGSEYNASYWLADMQEVYNLVETEFGYDASKITTGKPGETMSFKPVGESSDSTQTPTITPEETKTPTPSEKATSKPKNSQSPKTSKSPEPESDKKEDNDDNETQNSSPSPTPSQTPVQSQAPSLGSSSANGYVNGYESDNTFTDVNKSPTHNVITPRPATKEPTKAPVITPQQTPSQIPSISDDNDGGFKRPSANTNY